MCRSRLETAKYLVYNGFRNCDFASFWGGHFGIEVFVRWRGGGCKHWWHPGILQPSKNAPLSPENRVSVKSGLCQFHDGFCFYWPLRLFRPRYSALQDYIILQTVYRETKTIVTPTADNISISGRGNRPEIGLSQGLSCVKGRWPAMCYSPQLSWHRKRQRRLCAVQYGTHEPEQGWGCAHTHTQYCNQCAD